MAQTAETERLSIDAVHALIPDQPRPFIHLTAFGGATIGLHHPIPDYNIQMDAYDHHLLVYCANSTGRMLQTRDGTQFADSIIAGSTIIMPAGLESHWDGDTPLNLRIRVPVQVLNDVEDEVGHGHPFGLMNRFATRDPFLDRVASLILNEFQRAPDTIHRLMIESLFTALCAHLWRAHDVSKTLASPPPSPAKSAERAIMRSTEYIRENLGGDLSLKELAAIANISRFHFTRMFKRCHGIGPARYVQQLRIAEAKRLIADFEMPLAETAVAVGFSDQSHFTRWFREITGQTPGGWRQEFGASLHIAAPPEEKADHGSRRPQRRDHL